MTIKDIYQKSFQVTKSKKILWLYGLITAFFSFGLRISNNFRFNLPAEVPADWQLPELPYLPSQPQLEQFFPYFTQLFDQIIQFLSRIPVSTWLLLGTSLFITSTIFMLIRLFISQWALGSLIAGTGLAFAKKPFTIRSLSRLGLRTAPRLIILSIIPWFIYWLIPGLAVALAIPIFTNAPVWIKAVIGVALSTAAIIYFTVGLVLVWFSIILTRRLVVFTPTLLIPAWQKAWRLAQKHWRPLLGLALTNFIIKFLFISLITTVLASLAVLDSRLYQLVAPALLISLTLPLTVILGLVSLLLSILSKVFFESTWTLIYRQLK